MAQRSRTEYAARNTAVAVTAQIIAILAGYMTRVVFTHTLREEYVGINGLFTNILSVLALSELGIGSAITFALYKPIAEGDIEKQKSLMRMYRQLYRIVAGVVLISGLIVVLFMDFLVQEQDWVEHLIVLYLMYLLNSVASYLLIYKKALLDAHQLGYIGVLYQTAFLIVQNLLQILVILLTKSFILYVLVLICCTLLNNICVSKKADKTYPYLKDKEVQSLSKQEKGDIYKNIRAMLIHKMGGVVVEHTDSLLLSSLVGMISVGCYSNYYLVIGSVKQLLNQMFRAVSASVGNLGVEESRERIKKIFEAAFFAGQWVYGLAAICMYELIDSFVGFSFGGQFVFSKEITMLLCLNFYLSGTSLAAIVFRDALGLFRYDRYIVVIEVIVNLAASLILGRYWGAAGVFFGTTISTVATVLWAKPYILYKYKLNCSAVKFFLRYALYGAVTFAAWFCVDTLCRGITGTFQVVFTGRLACCLLITNLIYLLLYHRTEEFRLLRRKVLAFTKK